MPHSLRARAHAHASQTVVLDVVPHASVLQVKHEIQRRTGGVPAAEQRLVCCGRLLQDACTLAQCGVGQESTVHVALVLRGGIDFQNRAGSKFGGGGIRSASDAAVDRKEQLRKLAMETIDLSKVRRCGRCHDHRAVADEDGVLTRTRTLCVTTWGTLSASSA